MTWSSWLQMRHCLNCEATDPTTPAPIAAQTEQVCKLHNFHPCPCSVCKTEQVDAARLEAVLEKICSECDSLHVRTRGYHAQIQQFRSNVLAILAASLKQETQPPSVKCGKFAASFSPKRGEYFSCVLQPNHEGECRPGGTCVKHGKYIGEPNVTPCCHKWPDCAASSSPLETPAATSEDIELIAKSYQNRRERDAAKDLGIDVDEMRKCTPAPADTGAQDTAEFLKGKSVSDFLCPNVASTGDTPQPRNFENQYIGDWNSPYREHIAEKWLIANGCPGPSKTLIELLANFMKFAATLPAREAKEK